MVYIVCFLSSKDIHFPLQMSNHRMISSLSLISERTEQKPVEYFDSFFLHEVSSYKRVQIPQEGKQSSSLMTLCWKESTENPPDTFISKGWCTLKLVTWRSRGTVDFGKLQLSWREAEDKSPHNLLRVIVIALKRQKIPERTTVHVAVKKGKVSVCWTFILRDGWIYKYHSLLLT